MSTKLSNHPQYNTTLNDVKTVRDCIQGEAKIKRETTSYLKHPDMIDSTSDQAIQRYAAYIDGAEFDDYPADTLRSMLGAMTKGQSTIELPEALAYLEQNADGDGMPLEGLRDICYKNLQEVKYHILVAEMDSLQSLGVDDIAKQRLSAADLARLNLKASIKSYSRESLVDWDFERVNGVMQISLLVFEENERIRNKETLISEEVTSRLVLGLDGNGEYYQKKYLKNKNGEYDSEEAFYPTVGGKRLKWIPAEVVVDEEMPACVIPEATGYIRAVCSASLNRYQVSADEKEAMRHMQPTLFAKGARQGDDVLFKELNGGREHIAFGSGVANVLPNNMEVEVVGLGAQTEPFEKFYERNSKKLASFGANVSGDSQQTKTATQASSEAAKRVAVMHSIANNTERAIQRMVSYCGMFMGLWAPDQVEQAIESFTIKFPREFASERISPEEVAAINSLIMSGTYSKAEGVRMLVDGGFSVSDADTILAEVEEQGPQPVQGAANTQQQEDSQEEI